MKNLLAILIKVFGAMIIFVLSYQLYYVYIPNKLNVTLSDSQLKENIKRIAKKNSNIHARCRIWKEGEKGRFKGDGFEDIDNMRKNQAVISISGSEGFCENLSNREVYGIFDCWLYIQKKKFRTEAVAICWTYSPHGIYTEDRTTTITKTEFEKIYKKVNVDGMTQKEAAKALGDQWIKETGYTKE